MDEVVCFILPVEAVIEVVYLQLDVRAVRMSSRDKVAAREFRMRIFFRHVVNPQAETVNTCPKEITDRFTHHGELLMMSRTRTPSPFSWSWISSA